MTNSPTLTQPCRCFSRLAWLALLFILAPSATWPQETTPSPATDPETRRPRERTPNAPALPPVPTNLRTLAAAPRILVSAFQFEGNTVFSDQALALVAKPFVGRFITSEELQQLRRLLTQHYVDAGYISSGVIIPDQQIHDGIVRLRVIEGRLSGMEITGNQDLDTDYVQDRLRLGADGILDMNRLQEAIQLLHRNPLIRRIDAQLVPGNELGQSRLLTRVIEEKPYELSFSFNNFRPPSVGAYQLAVRGRHGNVSGRGDSLSLDYNLTETEQLDNYGLRYTLPLNAKDTALSFDYQHSNPTVVDSAFQDLDVASFTERLAVAINHPIRRSVDSTLTLGLRLDWSRNETSLLGRPFSFSSGPDNGRSSVTAMRLSLDWLERSYTQVLAARLSLNAGLDLFNATTHSVRPDGQFLSLLGQIQWARRLGKSNRQLVLRAGAQWAGDHLLALERFVVGGVNTVRGYRENRLVRDLGWSASAELRLPVLEDAEGRPTLQMVPFVDAGQAWDRKGLYQSRETLLSIGIGLRWNPMEHVDGSLYWGLPLKNREDDADNLQDQGLHFEISYQML